VTKAAVQKGLMIFLLLSLAGVPSGSEARASAIPPESPPRAPGAPDLIPLAVSCYSSRDAARIDLSTDPEGSDPGSLLMDDTGTTPSVFPPAAGGGSSRHKYLPVLFSLLVPGTGELYLGHYVRGGLLLGAEIAAWTGYAYYQDKGLDGRAEYESFADAHWDYDKWIDDHLATEGLVDPTFAELDSIGRNHWDQWPGYHTWYSKEEEKQNYYETIGKYDWFISGWEDWDGTSHDTSLRTTYRGMRTASNDDFDTADKFIYLSIATRVFSLIDTYFLVRRAESDASAKAESGLSIKARATGLASGEVALVYRFQ